MTFSRLSLSPPREQLAIATLGSDECGSAFVQTIVLAVVLALGSGAAMKSLAQSVRTKADCTGIAIVTMAVGAGPCGESSSPPASSQASAVPTGAPSFAAGPSRETGPSPALAAQQDQFSPEDEDEVKSLIADALDRHDGDIGLAFADLRDQRQRPENFYDSNLAIAADYLRARLETQRNGPIVAREQVEVYLALKLTGAVPPEGPGPVSPFSPLQAKYMAQGIEDELNEMSQAEKDFYNSSPGFVYGTLTGVLGLFKGEE